MARNLREFILFFCIIVLFALFGSTMLTAQSRQEHIHHMGHNVMPFSLDKTVHIFHMTETGGVERVIVRNRTAMDQVPMIQQHLQHEAMKFQQGDFSDPASLHGKDMPGLKELQAGSSQIKVTYAALSDGAEIKFETADLQLLTAIHRWFGAQLSEHGADARPE